MNKKSAQATQRFRRRYMRDRVTKMPRAEFLEWVDQLPRDEFFAMIDVHGSRNRAQPARQRCKHTKPLKAVARPKLIKSDELCKQLVCIAAFHLCDYPDAAKKVYRAVRTLQMLDAAAIAEGILAP